VNISVSASSEIVATCHYCCLLQDCWCGFMPSSLLSRPSAVAVQLWRVPLRCSTRQPLGYNNNIHTETLSGAPDEIVESRLPPDVHHCTASRHVLRGILRECTYLPDQHAASWIRQHAISRFRSYESKNKGRFYDEEYKIRLETLRRKSRQAMYQLQRANEGDRKMLLKALSMAYGRIGKRRRELLQPLLSTQENETDEKSVTKHRAAEIPDALVSSSASARRLDNNLDTLMGSSSSEPAISTRAPNRKSANQRIDEPVKAKVKAYINDLPAELRALVQSQIAASPPALARRNPRRLGLEIPELNSWYKPMPDVRVKNKLSEWYASLLSTVQPPLPDHEWQHLRDLALGVNRAQPPIPRRANLTPPPSVLEMVVARGKLPDNLFRKDYAHKITPRFMQRLWVEVFSQCSLMTYDSASDKWNVVWGHHVLQDSKTGRKVDAPAILDPTKATTTG
jgi:hypothetical protein